MLSPLYPCKTEVSPVLEFVDAVGQTHSYICLMLSTLECFVFGKQLQLLNFPGIGTPFPSASLSESNQIVTILESVMRSLYSLTGETV